MMQHLAKNKCGSISANMPVLYRQGVIEMWNLSDLRGKCWIWPQKYQTNSDTLWHLWLTCGVAMTCPSAIIPCGTWAGYWICGPHLGQNTFARMDMVLCRAGASKEDPTTFWCWSGSGGIYRIFSTVPVTLWERMWILILSVCSLV